MVFLCAALPKKAESAVQNDCGVQYRKKRIFFIKKLLIFYFKKLSLHSEKRGVLHRPIPKPQ
jgi:hypothetical protein